MAYVLFGFIPLLKVGQKDIISGIKHTKLHPSDQSFQWKIEQFFLIETQTSL